MTEYKIPTLQELYAEDGSAFMNDKFQQLLNQDPPAHWVKVEKNIPYLPIDKVEILLDRIFVGRVQIEVKEIKVVLNAIQATVRVGVFHPVLKQWVYNDGVGAMPIQLQKGATSGDLSRVNHSAIQMNAPASVSYAVKDAAERFGKIFGRDLSRKDTVNYQPAFISDPFVESSKQAAVIPENTAIIPPPPPPAPGQYQQRQQPIQQVQQFQQAYASVAQQWGQPTQQPTISEATYMQMHGRVIRPEHPAAPVVNGGFDNNFFNDPNQQIQF